MNKSKIGWTDYSFNPWWGCHKIAPECQHCYAETWARRMGYKNSWGAGALFRFFDDSHWNGPRQVNRKAEREKRRYRMFAGSMCDVFQPRRSLTPHRERLFALIEETPYLDWLLLTKRLVHVQDFIPDRWRNNWPFNAHLGITAGTPSSARAIPFLVETKRQYGIPTIFVSAEPLIAPFDLEEHGAIVLRWADAGGDPVHAVNYYEKAIDWLIIGGETGPQARPMMLAWAEHLVQTAQLARLPVFVKQLGSVLAKETHASTRSGSAEIDLPGTLNIREFPF